MAKKKAEKGNGKAIGAAIAVAGAALGAYFLYGTKEGSKQRKKISGWVLKAKGEVLEKIEGVKNLDESSYRKVVDTVMAKYNKVKAEHAPELEAVSKELHGYWNTLKKNLKKEFVAKKKPARKVATKKTA